MKKTYSFAIKISFFMLISVIFNNGYSQTEKQVQEIIKDYDMVKANQLLQNVKQREFLQRKEVETFAKNNKLPIYRENPKGGFDQLMYITPEGIPIYYSIDNVEAAISTRVPHLRSGGSLGLNLTGTGLVPRMWDGGPIHNHQEYAGRITMVDGTTRNTNSFHSIHVMGTIIGSGVVAAAKGMAPAATARSFDWDADESEAITEAMNGMLLSNHSYGVPVSSVSTTPWYIGAYSAEAYNWDLIAYSFPYYLPVMSAGNDGTATNPSPTTASYDKLNGNKNAKNILTIANGIDATFNATTPFAITGGGTVHSSSSQGPSDDRRIKPDVTGDGAGTGTGIYSAGNGSGTGGTTTQYATMLGTSMAAPNVTGTLTLLQQHASNVNGKFMRASTLKGLVCHTATDRGNVGPDAKQGWGLVDARSAAEAITNNGLTSWISEEEITQGQTITKQFVATGGTTPLLGSICWTDVADASKINSGVLNEANADITNDLDIRITQGASTFYPWRLTNVASANATRTGDNPIDNVERINVDTPTAAAVYTVTITHKGTLADGPQKFALVVTGVTSNFTFKTLTDTQTKCSNAGNAVYPFSLTKFGGANVTMTSANVPVGATLAFSANNFAANGSFDVTISNLSSVAAGSYTIDIIGNNGTETEIRKIYLTVFHPTFSAPVYIAPTDGLTGITTGTILTWQNDVNATSWDVQVSTSPTFSVLAYSGNVTTPSFNLLGLNSQTIYYWRVRPKNSCATPAYVSMRSFQTAIIDCTPASFVATDFSDGTIDATAGALAIVPVTVTGGYTIGKITASVTITHSYIQDMTIRLTGPPAIGSPVVILQQEACGGQPNINCTYDDAGIAPACSATSPAISGNIISFESLTNFDGLAADGVWTLTVNDPYTGDGGSVSAFSLKICSKSAITPVPVLTSNTINVVATSTSVITNADLNATSTAQTDVQQTYTLLETPILGTLKKNGTNLVVGNTFTQKDINDGIVAYTNTESTTTSTTFKVDVKNASNGWVPSRTVTINIIPCGSVTTSWNGSAWTNGVPSKITAVTFTGNYSSTSSLEACSIVVNSGINVVVNSGHTFTTNGSVTINGTGTFTVNNNAALKQIDAIAVNVGNVIVKRNSANMVRLDYTAWSSPVSGQQLQSFSPNTITTRFYQYLFTGTTTPTAYQSVAATSNFISGKGYMIRAANDWPITPTAFNGQFTGVPTNGNVSQSVGIGYNLLGNPYASPIDARAFLTSNPAIGTLYFWTHTVAAVGSTYPQNNYASYTTLGGVASAAGGAVPNGTIQTGQGFFINATAAGNANFFNTQRVNASVSTQFYRSSDGISTISESEKHRIWLNLNDTTNSYNQILVGYADNATNGFDKAIDGEVLDKSNTMLYNIINDSEFVIQGKGLPFVDTDEVPLGFKATTAGNYSISVENVDGLFTTQNIFLKDNVTNNIHDIKTSPYAFSTTEGVFNNRFQLVYRNALLSNESFVSNESLVVFTKEDKIQITASQEIASVQVFDILGRTIYNNKNINEKSLEITSVASKNQALIVKVVLKNGETLMKKIVL